MTMRSTRDKLRQIGVQISDDVFGLMLVYSMPASFPDVSTSSKGSLLSNPGMIVSTSDVTQALGAANVAFRQKEISSEAMKVLAASEPRQEHRHCNYCYIKGHVKADCQKWIAKEQ